MKFNFFKNTVISALVFGFALTSSAYANPVTQQAYYDTFTFRVNGIVPYISDMALKPFTSNSRIYVPIATLRNLGIASVEWKDGIAGAPGEVIITPSSSTMSTQYEQRISELSIQMEQKDTKIRNLEASVKSLTEENNELKKKNKNSTPDYDDRDVRNKVSDLEDDANRGRNFNKIRINSRDFDIRYDFSYRRSFDVNLYIRGLTSSDVDYIKSSSSTIRDLEYILEDLAKEILRDDTFRNVDIYFNVYDDSNRNRNLASYDYRNGRLRGDISR